MPKIFLFNNGKVGEQDVVGVALAEDGALLASHISSNEAWLRHDLGLTSKWKHDLYEAHYPSGYELEWVDNAGMAIHAELQAAVTLNQQSDLEQS